METHNFTSYKKNLNAILSLPDLGQFDEELADSLEKGGKGMAGSGLKITI